MIETCASCSSFSPRSPGAVVAEVVGIEGIVGAFFAGLALNRLVPNRGALMDRVEFFGAASSSRCS